MSLRKFSVICPFDSQTVKQMEIMLISHDGKLFPFPCDGCHDANGSKTCQECTAAITSLFYKNPQLDTSKPFRPL